MHTTINMHMVDATKIGGAFDVLAFVNSCELCDAAAQAARNCAQGPNEHVAVATEDVRNPVGGLGSRLNGKSRGSIRCGMIVTR